MLIIVFFSFSEAQLEFENEILEERAPPNERVKEHEVPTHVEEPREEIKENCHEPHEQRSGRPTDPEKVFEEDRVSSTVDCGKDSEPEKSIVPSDSNTSDVSPSPRKNPKDELGYSSYDNGELNLTLV